MTRAPILAASVGRRPGRSVVAGMHTGVTLIELLVVLVLMGISAAVVLPAFSASAARASLDEGNDAVGAAALASVGLLPRDSTIDPLVTSARRHAIKRGEPLHLRVAGDGVWALAPVKGGASVDEGRAAVPLAWLPDLTVDAMGTCMLAAQSVRPANAETWDAFACRWRAPRESVADRRSETR